MYKIEYKPGFYWMHPERMPLIAARLIRSGDDGNDTVIIPDFATNRYDRETAVIAMAPDLLAGNTEVEKVVIGKNIQSIPAGVFSGCSNLRQVTIPAGVTKIHAGTFAGCDNLRDVFYEGTYEQWKLMDIKNSEREVKLSGECVPGTATEVVVSDMLVHVPGNEPLVNANVHFVANV